jgi:predicted negative regulator of RcsB-dependent stress response
VQVSQTEQEQLEDLKKWWKENAKAVIAGVVIGLSVLFAVWAWRDYSRSQGEAASAEYQLLVGEVSKGDTEAGLKRGVRIINQFGTTSYAVFAAFALAKLELEGGHFGEAHKHLEWALNHAKQDELQHIARLRLARVMLAEGQHDAALKLLSLAQPGSFLPAYEELKGDLYLASGQTAAAQTAYQRALNAAAQDDIKQLIRIKLDDVGAPPPAAKKAP